MLSKNHDNIVTANAGGIYLSTGNTESWAATGQQYAVAVICEAACDGIVITAPNIENISDKTTMYAGEVYAGHITAVDISSGTAGSVTVLYGREA